MNEPVVKVIFRIFPEGDVIAIFPNMPYNHDPSLCGSYMRIGQHGAASRSLIRSLQPANPAEYAPLKTELEDFVGYRLRVLSSRY